MKSFAAAALILAGCTDPLPQEERPLADMPKLTAHVDVDVGVPQDPFGAPNVATGVSVFIDYAASVCYMLHPSAIARVDGQEPVLMIGGILTSDKDNDPYCTKPAIYLDDVPAPRDTSTITLTDDSATYSISVARLFVNPRLTVAPVMSIGPQSVRVDDPRTIASATVWFRSSDGARSWVKPVDTSTFGELRFVVPPESRGQGTLGIVLTIRDSDIVSCVGFAACAATVRGGGAFAVTIE